MTIVVLDRERYGRYARASAIADYFECVLWKRAPERASLQLATMQDTLADAQVSVPPSPFRDGEDGTPEDSLSRIVAVLTERQTLLGERYPFEVAGSTVVRRSTAPQQEPYLSLLALCLAHAYGVARSPSPADVFESIVTKVWSNRGWLSHCIGAASNLRVSLPTAAAALRLHHTFENVVISDASVDENVDTLSHFWWKDDRAGQHVMLVQATVRKSESWEAKFSDPKKKTWQKLLPDVCSPQVCLAVPYHVEKEHFAKLVQDADGLLLDRLRLVQFLEDVSEEERKLVKQVQACPLEE